MMNFINNLGTKKVEAILVGLVLLFKENITALVSDMLFSDMDSLVNQILN